MNRSTCRTLLAALAVSLGAPLARAGDLPANAQHHDLVIYGGASAGVIAAVQAKRMGKPVVIVCPDKHLGGLSSGGLGWTDTGDKSGIGGISREFYQRVKRACGNAGTRDNDSRWLSDTKPPHWIEFTIEKNTRPGFYQ
ncbi:MAG: FAD-dependent oxidoreductase [Kiritimatiellaeota bacterium]|nr:FAD-dependent oxidoreductase [Kiritimatiellota bacterium]